MGVLIHASREARLGNRRRRRPYRRGGGDSVVAANAGSLAEASRTNDRGGSASLSVLALSHAVSSVAPVCEGHCERGSPPSDRKSWDLAEPLGSVRSGVSSCRAQQGDRSGDAHQRGASLLNVLSRTAARAVHQRAEL